MKSFWFLLAAMFLLTSCNNNRKETIAKDYIPKNAIVVFNISDSESLNSNLNNNNFFPPPEEYHICRFLFPDTLKEKHSIYSNPGLQKKQYML